MFVSTSHLSQNLIPKTELLIPIYYPLFPPFNHQKKPSTFLFFLIQNIFRNFELIWHCGCIVNVYHLTTSITMKIRNHQEYTIAYEKAAIMIEAGFGGNFERERYFREIINAIIDYEKNPVHVTYPNQNVGMSA